MKARKEGRHGTKPIGGYLPGAEPVEPDRNKDWAEQRIKALDARLGEGKGAARERNRLAEIIAYEKTPMSKRLFASDAEKRRFETAQKKKANG